MAKFDTISKSLIRTYPDGFLAFLLGQPSATVVEILNPEQPKTQIMDNLLRVQVGGREVLVHCELQTTDSTELAMPRRMASYMGHMGVLSSLVCDDSIIYSLISEDIMNRFPLLESFRQRGIEQGGRECAIEDLLDVLEIRFGLAASDPLAAHLGAINDVQQLKQLHRAAIQVASLEAFRLLLEEAE